MAEFYSGLSDIKSPIHWWIITPAFSSDKDNVGLSMFVPLEIRKKLALYAIAVDKICGRYWVPSKLVCFYMLDLEFYINSLCRDYHSHREYPVIGIGFSLAKVWPIDKVPLELKMSIHSFRQIGGVERYTYFFQMLSECRHSIEIEDSLLIVEKIGLICDPILNAVGNTVFEKNIIYWDGAEHGLFDWIKN